VEYPPVNNPADAVFVCFPRELVPVVGAAFRLLAWRSQWDTAADAAQGRQLSYWLQEQLMYNCTQIFDDIGVLLAKAHSLDYDPDLAASMPQLAAALNEAETNDTNNMLSGIYRHGQQSENIEAFTAALLMAMSDTMTASEAMGAVALIAAGGTPAENLLNSIKNQAIGKATNQVELYLKSIADLLGPNTLPDPD
jgi:hypothetical protein